MRISVKPIGMGRENTHSGAATAPMLKRIFPAAYSSRKKEKAALARRAVIRTAAAWAATFIFGPPRPAAASQAKCFSSAAASDAPRKPTQRTRWRSSVSAQSAPVPKSWRRATCVKARAAMPVSSATSRPLSSETSNVSALLSVFRTKLFEGFFDLRQQRLAVELSR